MCQCNALLVEKAKARVEREYALRSAALKNHVDRSTQVWLNYRVDDAIADLASAKEAVCDC